MTNKINYSDFEEFGIDKDLIKFIFDDDNEDESTLVKPVVTSVS